MALNRSPVLMYVHQSCSVQGNDLNHLVEGNVTPGRDHF